MGKWSWYFPPDHTIERASIFLNHPMKNIKALQWIKRDNSGLSLNPKKDVQQLVCSKSWHLYQLLYSTKDGFFFLNHHILITIRHLLLRVYTPFMSSIPVWRIKALSPEVEGFKHVVWSFHNMWAVQKCLVCLTAHIRVCSVNLYPFFLHFPALVEHSKHFLL